MVCILKTQTNLSQIQILMPCVNSKPQPRFLNHMIFSTWISETCFKAHQWIITLPLLPWMLGKLHLNNCRKPSTFPPYLPRSPDAAGPSLSQWTPCSSAGHHGPHQRSWKQCSLGVVSASSQWPHRPHVQTHLWEPNIITHNSFGSKWIIWMA